MTHSSRVCNGKTEQSSSPDPEFRGKGVEVGEDSRANEVPQRPERHDASLRQAVPAPSRKQKKNVAASASAESSCFACVCKMGRQIHGACTKRSEKGRKASPTLSVSLSLSLSVSLSLSLSVTSGLGFNEKRRSTALAGAEALCADELRGCVM